jgi:hypothetical protein
MQEAMMVILSEGTSRQQQQDSKAAGNMSRRYLTEVLKLLLPMLRLLEPATGRDLVAAERQYTRSPDAA